MSSIVVDLVYCGVQRYADSIPCDENDPLHILIDAEETNMEASGYTSQSDVIARHQLERHR